MRHYGSCTRANDFVLYRHQSFMIKVTFLQIFVDRIAAKDNLLEFVRIISDAGYELKNRPITMGRRKQLMDGLPSTFVVDKTQSFLYWLEFNTEEEAAVFKLTYL
jgi:hypothetical protein